MMTEEEAKKKWCPEVRLSAISENGKHYYAASRDRCFFVPPNTKDPERDITKCIASACMMWRWENQDIWINRVEEGEKVSGMDTQEAADCLPRLGYCGLGGKP